MQLHFEENHSREDQAFVQSLKDLFGKAKKKILNEEDEAIAVLAGSSRLQVVKARPEHIHPVSGIRTDVFPGWTPPEVKCSHFAEFKSKSCHKILNYNCFNRIKIVKEPSIFRCTGTYQLILCSEIRSCRVDRYATETNRLIVRLDRLLEVRSFYP